MENLIGDALHVVTNPFESAGKLVTDPVGSLQSVVGEGLTSLSDLLATGFGLATTAETTYKTNTIGYTVALALVLWVFMTGFSEDVQWLLRLF